MTSIAENLNKLMTLEGITPSDLSRKTGVDRSVLHKILSGATKNPSIDSIKSILEHYGFEEVVLGSSQQSSLLEIPILDWSEISHFASDKKSFTKHKMVKIGFPMSRNAFGLLIEHTLDSRFEAGALIIVDPEKEVKNFNYIIVIEMGAHYASLKRYILDGSLIYLKSIDPSIRSIEFDPAKHKIVGVVVQSIFNLE